MKGKVRGGFREDAFQSLLGIRHQKGGTIVVPFADEAAAEELVAFCVRRIAELGEHLEMRFLDANPGRRLRARGKTTSEFKGRVLT